MPGAKAATMIVPGYCSRCPNVAMIYLDRDVHRHSRLTCPLDRAYRTATPARQFTPRARSPRMLDNCIFARRAGEASRPRNGRDIDCPSPSVPLRHPFRPA